MSTDNKKKKKISGGLLAIIVVLVVIVAGFAYYFLFLEPTNNEIKNLENQNRKVQAEIAEYNKTAEMAESMVEYLDNKFNTSSKLGTYSNIKKELSFLNNILNKYLKAATEDNYSISFDDPYVDEETLDYTGGDKDKNNGIYAAVVRRPLKISFTASDFSKTNKIIKAIEKGEYRTVFNDISVSDKSEQEDIEAGNKHRTGFNDNKDECTVTINMEFIETIHGASDISGVEIPEQEEATDDSSEVSETESYESDVLSSLTS